MALSKDEIVKQDIIIQAQKLFKQFGLKKTTMDEIAAACGKAKSTLYHYYKSKEEVFGEVIDKEIVSLRKLVKQDVDTTSGLKNKIETYFISFHEEVFNKMNIYRVVKNELLNDAIARMHFKRIMKYEQDYLTRMIEDAYDSGEYKELDKKDIAWFAEILIAAFFGIVRYTIENDEGIDHDKLVKTARSIIPKIFQ